VAFAGAPALYKLYLVQPHNPAAARAEQETLSEFLELLMPEVNRVLFEQPKATGRKK
jgi:hypothetical protein